MIRVVIADDQALRRAGFRLIPAAEPDIELAGEAADGAEAVRVAEATSPDVVIMDLRMPGMNGIEAARALTDAGSAARVIMLTTFNMDEYVYDALLAGASGFLLKDSPPEELIAGRRHPGRVTRRAWLLNTGRITPGPAPMVSRSSQPCRGLLAVRGPRPPTWGAGTRPGRRASHLGPAG